jgi:hypothetical protein
MCALLFTKIRLRVGRVSRLMPVAAVLIANLSAQTIVPTAPSYPGPVDGVRLYHVSGYSTYYSSGLPYSSSSISPGQIQANGLWTTGGSVLIGMRRTRPRTQFRLSYSASYSTASGRYSNWNGLNQFISAGLTRKLSSRWTLGITANLLDTTAMELLLNPATLSGFSTAPANADELAAAMRDGALSDGGIAAYLTGSPFLEDPSQTLQFGRRLLSYNISTRVSYSHSPRLTFYFGGVSASGQYLSRGYSQPDIPDELDVPRSTSVFAAAGFTYGLSPRTEVGLHSRIERIRSRFQDAYTGTASGSLSRRLSPNLILRLDGGVAMRSPIRSVVPLSSDPQLVAGVHLGYNRRSHTFTLKHSRTISSAYGFGSGLSTFSGATWLWRAPNARWHTFSSGGYQELSGTGYATIRGWMFASGAGRTLGSNVGLQVQYAFLNNSGSASGIAREFMQHSIRVSLNWSPGIPVVPIN